MVFQRALSSVSVLKWVSSFPGPWRVLKANKTRQDSPSTASQQVYIPLQQPTLTFPDTADNQNNPQRQSNGRKHIHVSTQNKEWEKADYTLHRETLTKGDKYKTSIKTICVYDNKPWIRVDF